MNCDVSVLVPSVFGHKWKWEVKNFSSTNFASNFAVDKDRLLSPIFSTKYDDDSTVEWRLCLYPKGCKDGNEEYLSIYLELVSENPVTASITIAILNTKNEIYKLTLEARLFTMMSKYSGFRRFIKRSYVLDQQNHVLENDTLKILCQIHLNPSPIFMDLELFPGDDGSNIEEENKKSNYRLKEFDDFEKMFESEAFSDMTFVVEEKKIHAHKAVLVSRSPVFEVMLQRYTKDEQQDTFEITGIKYEVMKELLRFMYVGKVIDLDEKASDLLIAADKYSIAGLKTLCEDALYKNLDIDNALEYLNLAAICDATVLKSQVIDFIACNLKDIVEKPEFDSFGNLNSKVICEVVRAIAKKNSK